MSNPAPCCGLIQGSCVCGLPFDHDGPHHCLAPDVRGIECGGQWYEDPFAVVTWPGRGSVPTNMKEAL